MSSSKVLTNLNIRKYPSYESYKASTPGEDDLCVVDENGDLLLQVQTLPTASAAYEGRVVQVKTSGYFYKCVSDGQDPATYSWIQQEVQPQPYIPDSLEQRSDLSTTGVLGKIVQYTGATDANYTNGYVYKVVNVPATATISQTVGSSLSDLTVDADGFIRNISGDTIGTFVLTYTGSIWTYNGVGYDISSYITYSGTPEESDEITVEVLTLSTTAWQQCDVQPAGSSLPDQTGNSGKFLTTDGTNASWATVVGLKNAATFWSSLSIQTESGYGADVTSATDVVAIGAFANASANSAIAIGPGAKATAAHAIMISSDERGVFRTNSDANTFKVANANGNFEIMSSDGTIPEARLADTTNAAQGQVLTLDSNLNAVWQAGGGGSSYTAGTGIDITNDVISVADPVLVNKTSKSHSLAISDCPSFNDSHMGTNAIYIGRTTSGFDNAYVGNNAVGIGLNQLGDAANYGTAINAGSGEYSVFVGSGTQGDAGNHNTGIGYKTGADFNKKYGVAIGVGAWIGADNAIQICAKGNDTVVINSDPNTVKVANANGNFEIMSADGTIPEARLADTTNAQQGDVLTLDSTGNAVWQASSGSGLPSQTGNAGKFLQTNGTSASWASALANSSLTGTSIQISNFVGGSTYGVCVGNQANATASYHVVLGYSATVSGQGGIAVGASTTVSAAGAIQLNSSGSAVTNSDANTFKVANANGNFEIMSSDGTVPTARLTKVNTTATLAVADWSSNTQTVTVSGVAADSVVFVSPAPASASDYASAGILCTAQAADSLTFTCTTTPSNAITVNVVCM